jgi:molybdopterin adenylyltransferase
MNPVSDDGVPASPGLHCAASSVGVARNGESTPSSSCAECRIASVNAVVITVSDSCFHGTRLDVSGPQLVQLLQQHGFTVAEPIVVPDDQEQIAALLRQQAARGCLLVTTGGTGIARRDVTPEATRSVCERILDGFAERMRYEGLRDTPLAPLSRAVCGTLGTSLIVNVPGSPRGAVRSLTTVLPLVPHALALLRGETEHAANASDDKVR